MLELRAIFVMPIRDSLRRNIRSYEYSLISFLGFAFHRLGSTTMISKRSGLKQVIQCVPSLNSGDKGSVVGVRVGRTFKVRIYTGCLGI